MAEEKKGFLGKITDAFTQDDDEKRQREESGKKHGGLLGKIEDAVMPDRDRDERKTERSMPPGASKPSEGGVMSGGILGKIKDRFDGDDKDEQRTAPPAPAETVDAMARWGKASGSGQSRMYTTRPGDALEGIAAYFYGDVKHVQRLLDDNPFLSHYAGPLPGGVEIKVSEDAARGDSVKPGY